MRNGPTRTLPSDPALRNTAPAPVKSLALAAALAALSVAARAEPYTYLTAVAEPGDGMYALLRRFGLPASNCYQDRFLALNRLGAEEPLHAGRDYRVPVLVYAYDGRSIRTTIGLRDLPLARSIQAYNRGREAAGQHAAPYEQSRELWVPYGLLFCESATGAAPLSPAPAEATAVLVSRDTREPAAPARAEDGYAIFGEAYAQVKRKDSRLAGQVFYLVSGHGGPDPGAVGRKRDHTLCEDEYAYDVVLRLARAIIEHGGVPYVVVRDEDDGIRDEEYLACDQDETVWGGDPLPRDQRLRLAQRSDVINELARERAGVPQTCIVVHVDSRHAEAQTDLFFYHQRGDAASEGLAEEMRATMRRNYRRHGRTREYQGTVSTRDLHMLREVDVPTVYIELGNIQHAFDQKRVLKASNRQALAKWFAEGLVRELGR